MTIKVKNISGLENYGTSIHGFAGKFELAANDTVREFNTNLEGEKADAINAFFKKLNDIQTAVFSEAPEAIMSFGKHIFTFTEEIKGIGFSDIAYTDYSALTVLTESLRTPQRNEIEIVKSELVTILNEAIDAMGEGDSSLGDYDKKADSYIAEEIKARESTHSKIVMANSNLFNGVNNSSDYFNMLTRLTKNARAVVQNIEPANVLTLIVNGRITNKNINYLDLISTESDAKIAIAAWEDRLEDTTSLQPDTIDGGYKIISTELAIGVEENKKDKIQKYFDSLGKVPVEISKEHIQNLKTANDYQAIQLQAAQAGLDELKYDENSSEMIELKSRLRALSKLNGLLLSVEHLGLGTSESTSYSNMTQYHNNISYDLEITKLDDTDNISFTVTKRQTTAIPEVKHYVSGLTSDYSESVLEERYKDYTDNRKEHAKEGLKLIGNLADISTDFIPGGKATKIAVSSFKTLLSTFDSFDFKELGNGISEALPENITIRGRKIPLKTFTKGAGRFLNSVKGYNENLSKLDEKELKIRNDIVRGFTNKGTWYLKQERISDYDFFKGEVPANNVDTLNINSMYYYDYDAYLRERYLDKEGVSQYLNGKNYDDYFDLIEKNTDSDIVDYLKGRSNLEISNMDYKQLQQLKNALNSLPGKSGFKDFKDNFLWNNAYMEAQ